VLIALKILPFHFRGQKMSALQNWVFITTLNSNVLVLVLSFNKTLSRTKQYRVYRGVAASGT
jgi:hypothetical protein